MQLFTIGRLDIVFTALILIGVVYGYNKTLTQLIGGTHAVLVGFGLAMFAYSIPAGILMGLAISGSDADTRATSWQGIANWLGFIIIFFGTPLVWELVKYIAETQLKAATLKWLNQLLGALYGFLYALMVSTIIVLSIVTFLPPNNFVPRSLLMPQLITSASQMVRAAPSDLKERFEKNYKQIQGLWLEEERRRLEEERRNERRHQHRQ